MNSCTAVFPFGQEEILILSPWLTPTLTQPTPIAVSARTFVDSDAWMENHMKYITYTSPAGEGKSFYSSKVLVIFGINDISKNNEQKRAKATLMTLNLIGIPCQVWPWKDISHSTSDCRRVRISVSEGGGLLCSSFQSYFYVCSCGRNIHSYLCSTGSLHIFTDDLCVCVSARDCWACRPCEYTRAAVRPVGCRDPWPTDMCVPLSAQ